MTFIRLEKFVEQSKIPSSVLVHLLSGNAIPLRIDAEGFLEIEINEEVVKDLIKMVVDDAASGDIQSDGLGKNLATARKEEFREIVERSMREQFGDILKEAVARFTEER